MNEEALLDVAGQAMWLLAMVSAPILGAALLVGLLLGMVQAATSINEQTLSFVPKLIAVGAILLLYGAALMGLVVDFAAEVFARIPDIVR